MAFVALEPTEFVVVDALTPVDADCMLIPVVAAVSYTHLEPTRPY